MDIQVSGQQYLWRYQYPNGAVSFHDMVVPRDTTVMLTLKANDVVHWWWIRRSAVSSTPSRGYDQQDVV